MVHRTVDRRTERITAAAACDQASVIVNQHCGPRLQDGLERHGLAVGEGVVGDLRVLRQPDRVQRTDVVRHRARVRLDSDRIGPCPQAVGPRLERADQQLSVTDRVQAGPTERTLADAVAGLPAGSIDGSGERLRPDGSRGLETNLPLSGIAAGSGEHQIYGREADGGHDRQQPRQAV